MGLLDDAIREHLELKLRRGAAAEEVSREEQEALGPVRRGPTPPEAEPLALSVEDDFEPATELSPLAAGEPDDDGYEDDEDDEELEPVGPAHAPGGSVPATPADVGETEEWGFEDDEEEEDDEPAGDEDVLEQTPEFLSETPEHDRLWFEQKPPRDFDFDG